MPLARYHIVIFKSRGDGGSRNIHFRAWIGLFILLLIIGMVIANIWLFSHYRSNVSLQERLRQAERQLAEQNSQLSGIAERITGMQSDLGRVQQFNTRLRMMMNLDGEVRETVSEGQEEFSRSFLSLYKQEMTIRRMNNFLRQLSEDLSLEEVSQQELLNALYDNREILASMPSIWPVQGFLTSRFGYRTSPFTGKRDFHRAIDIGARTGTPVIAPGAGTVTFSGVRGAYGNLVSIRHGAGITTVYGHLQRSAVREGQSVQRGTVIGYVGSTGRSTGPHLHYEVILSGVHVDPLRYILN